MDEQPHSETIIVRRRGSREEEPHEYVVIKRHSSHEDEHHGGAWKIAFADFMTAMMAFFLVLWIINATDKNTKSIIARYFNPVKLEESQRTPKSIHAEPNHSAGPTEGKNTGDEQETEVRTGGPPEGKDVGVGERSGVKTPAEAIDPANPKPTMSEGVLFSDPYRSLDAIAGPSSPDVRAIERAERVKDPSEAGSEAADAFRDPFRRAQPQGAIEALNGAPKPPAAANDWL